jgi:uncharacterized delta-60 repeat protein
VAIQTDEKIVVTGRAVLNNKSVFALARYNSDGALDNTFDRDGRAYTDFSNSEIDGASPVSAAIQKDGKIVVGGSAFNSIDYYDYIITYYDFALARYNIDGSADTAFSHDGKLTTNIDTFNFDFDNAVKGDDLAKALEIQSDGKIVLAGNVAFANPSEVNPFVSAIARYNTDGTLDTTFSGDGKLTTPLNTGGSSDMRGDIINDIAIWGNKLYMAGGQFVSSTISNGLMETSLGVVMKYRLDNENINKPPTVTLTIPNDIVKYSAPARIKLNATATDEDGTITKVEFYNGTHLLHTEYVAPYGFTWSHVPAGKYTLTAKATDNSGLVTTSAAVHISIVSNKAPTVRIIKPHNNQSFQLLHI